jgi:transposase
VRQRLPAFRLESGPAAARFAAIPLLVFAAPFIIMRNSVRGRRIERRRAQMVMVATVIAGLWSLMSGTVVVMAFEAVIRA